MKSPVEKLPGEPIILCVVTKDPAMMETLSADLAELVGQLDAQPEPVYMIYDLRGVSLGLDDILNTTNATARKPGAMLHHPNIRQNVLVATDALYHLVAQGLSSVTFGQVKMPVYKTLEQALDYCREQIRVAADNPAGET